MAIVNISEAARLTGKSRTTIYKLIEQGKVSKSIDSVTNAQGVDTSELIRVFGGISEQSLNNASGCSVEHNLTLEMQSVEQSKILLMESEIKRLNSVLEEKGVLIDAQKKHIESLDNAMRLLEDQRPKTPPTQTEEPKKEESKGFLRRLFNI